MCLVHYKNWDILVARMHFLQNGRDTRIPQLLDRKHRRLSIPLRNARYWLHLPYLRMQLQMDTALRCSQVRLPNLSRKYTCFLPHMCHVRYMNLDNFRKLW